MKSFRGLLLILSAVLIPGLALGQSLEDTLESDGWYSWRVTALADAREWCCYTWSGGVSLKTSCPLNGHHRSQRVDSYSDTRNQPGPGDQIQIYALIEDRKLKQLTTLSASCSVDSDQGWTDLGQLETAQSLDWLTHVASQTNSLDSELTAAIAMHAGAQSLAELKHMARTGARTNQRREAIFWLGQLRVEDAKDVLLEIMIDDADPQIREHAIFSYAQSPATDRLDVLTSIIGNSAQPMHDRQRALFWLVQFDDGSGVDYIQDLLLNP